ncbi:MAG: flagellar hook-associated protein FlgL [Planctomycetota bacterium]|jgi:flagellar hook-associated protein 3 FlgL
MGQTLGSIYGNVSFALHLHTEALARLQEQAATGARINRPSDDPSGAYQVLGLNSQERSVENYIDRLAEVISTVEFSSAVVDDMMSEVVDAKTRLSQVTSGIYTDEQRKITAEGINDILEHLVVLANTKHVNQYIFGGGDTASEPYVVERTDGKITRVTYQGSAEARIIELAPTVQSGIFYAGDDVFRSDSRSAPMFIGDTGAAAGTGTSSVRGDVWLTVIHDGSNYKISVDDGATYETVPAGGDTNQDVTDSRTGQVLYVDTTQISATGVDLVRVPGTYDVFNTLVTVRDVLENDRGLSEGQLQQLRSSSLTSLDEVVNLLNQTEVLVGAKIGFLSDLKDGLTSRQYNFEDEATHLQEADIAQVAIDISRRQVLYEMSLSVAAQIMSKSLLDYLR